MEKSPPICPIKDRSGPCGRTGTKPKQRPNFAVGAAALGGPRETDRPNNWGRSPHPPRIRSAPSPKGEGFWATKGHPLFLQGIAEMPVGADLCVRPDDREPCTTGADTQVRPYSPPETSRGAFQEPILIRHGFAVPPSPLEGEGYLYRKRWLGKLRRRSGTAPAAIFANPGPGGPGGI